MIDLEEDIGVSEMPVQAKTAFEVTNNEDEGNNEVIQEMLQQA